MDRLEKLRQEHELVLVIACLLFPPFFVALLIIIAITGKSPLR